MQESFDHYFEEESLYQAISRFEDMIKSNITRYFDVCEFEIIIDYYLDQHNFKHAQEAVFTAMKQHPGSSEIKFRLAQLYIQSGKPAKGIQLLRDIEKLESTNTDFYLLKGTAYNLLGKKEDASKAFDNAIQFATDGKDEVIYNIAYAYITTRRYKLAERYLLLAHEVNPKNTSVIHELALIFERIDNFENSVNFYKKYLDIDPFNDNIWLSLGLTYTSLEQYNKALESYDFAIAIDQANVSALFSKANTLVNLNRNREAIETYTDILEHEPNNVQAYTYIGECYEKLEYFKKSIFYFKKALQIESEYADAWYGLGIAHYQQENFKESLEYFLKASSIDPENSDFWFMLGEVYRKLKILDKSAEAYNRVIELDPNDHEAWICRAELSFKDNNDLKGAIRILSQAFEFNSDISLVNYLLGTYYFKNNQSKLAVHHFEKGLKINFLEHEGYIKELSGKAKKILRPIIKKYQNNSDE
jgi:tetratricopeptide (TPR) repeat protein